jgi:uncharacterized protein YPO0396
MTLLEHGTAPVTLVDGVADLAEQWRAESIQLVNWGGFEGHHAVEFADTATLLSGASGTGKSTLLDAYIALMMDSNTPFNGASNDHMTGRARGEEQRNILSYMRGKTDTSREPGTGRLRDEVLRGQDSATWSGVAMTWRSEAGECLTAIRLYYARASAQSLDDVVKRLATIDRAFDLSGAAEFAAQEFPQRAMEARLPGLKFSATYLAFAATLHTRLGIGTGGDGARALKLLARIQGGRQFATVDRLYKDMVLEEPRTFAAASQAVEHFDDIEGSYQTMRTAEKQVETLQAIPGIQDAMTEALDEAALIDTIHADPADPSTPFALWRCRAECSLLDDAVAANRAERKDAAGRAETARARRRALRAEIADVQKQQHLNGGDALEAAERDLKALDTALATATEERAKFAARTEALGRHAATREQFEALRRDSEAFLSGFPALQAELRDQRDQTIKDTQPLLAEQVKLRREAASLAGRRGLVPHDLHAARLAIAEAMSLTADDLPFVAELIDMQQQFEPWRTAAELALGGFAVTMLVDQERLPRLRRSINSLEMRRRLRFEGAPSHQPVRQHPDASILPGRFQFRDSPFSGWLTNTLVDRLGYVCVDSSAILDTARFGLTITGQTRHGQRGAHGGHGAPRVIGFSNEERLHEIAAQIEHIDTSLAALERAKNGYDDQAADLGRQRDGHMHVTVTTWEAIDVAGIEDQIRALTKTRAELLASNDILNNLKAREARLLEKLEPVERAMYTAETAIDNLDNAHDGLLADQGHAAAFLQRMEDNPSVILTPAQESRLLAEYERTGRPYSLAGFRESIIPIAQALAGQASQKRRDAESQEKILHTTFERFQDQWERPNLGTGADSYGGYREILDHLLAEGLHERRAKFSRQVSDWTGVDLLALHGAYEESIEEIEARLDPVNEILARLPFGAHRDRLHINLRRTESRDVTQFRRELKILASDTTHLVGDHEIEARFARIKRFIDRIRKSGKISQREYFIDVRRHVEIDAERRDAKGRQLSVYSSIGGKSGGESQELVAFIVGAALRYQLGDASLSRPRYAPVFLDEGFVKSDSEFTGRAVRAWQVLGFQLIIGAPLDKVTGIEPYMDELYQVTKNASNHSHVKKIHPATRAGRAGIPA